MTNLIMLKDKYICIISDNIEFLKYKIIKVHIYF